MTPAWIPTKGAKTKRLAEARFRQLMMHDLYDEGPPFFDLIKRTVPDAWRTLEMDLDVEEPKEKITLYVDRSVAKIFKCMGKGFHARINRILATWVQMKIAENVNLEMDMMTAIEQAEDEKEVSEDATEIENRRLRLAKTWLKGQVELDIIARYERAERYEKELKEKGE